VQRARASLHGAGLAHCVLQQGDLQTVTATSASFDVVVLDRVAGSRARPEQLVADATRVLRPGGRIVIVEDYDTLAARAAAGNPLAMLRDWLARGGLKCARMRPVDTAAAHLLVATAALEQEQAAA
jgi:ArsR family transcriptional regulator